MVNSQSSLVNSQLSIVYFGSSSISPLVLPYLSNNFDVELVVDENTKIEAIEKAEAEVAVLAAYGKILPKSVLEHFKFGILNIHPSLLPKYRGPSPVQTSILNGDKETGVTVIRLDEEMDHGPILAQKSIEISKKDTAESLFERLFPLGAELITEKLEKYTKNEVKLTPQSHNNATYTKMLKRESGFFELETSPSLEKLDLMIRAFYPWPGVWTKWNDKILKFLPGNKVQVEGKKPSSYKDFINGYPNLDKKLLNLLG